jgi:hypothetical protein
MPYTLSIEISTGSINRSKEDKHRILAQQNLPDEKHALVFLEQCIFEQRHHLRLDRVCFQVANDLWPNHATVKVSNLCEDPPYILLQWFGPNAKSYTEILRSASLAATSTYPSAEFMDSVRHDLKRRLLTDLKSSADLKSLFEDILFKGAVHSILQPSLDSLGIAARLDWNRRYKKLPKDKKRLLHAFFNRWVGIVLNQIGVGKILPYLHSRIRDLSSININDKYPRIPEFFSLMNEIAMDMEIILSEFENPNGGTHIIYAGSRHIHRIGAFLGSLKGAVSNSWSILHPQTVSNAPLIYTQEKDEADIRAQEQKGGKMSLKEAFRRIRQIDFQALRQAGWFSYTHII